MEINVLTFDQERKSTRVLAITLSPQDTFPISNNTAGIADDSTLPAAITQNVPIIYYNSMSSKNTQSYIFR